MESPDILTLKIIVIGEPDAGKINVIRRYCHGVFEPTYRATIGVDFAVKFVTIGGKELQLRMWDVAGQEKYIGMTRVYYKDAQGAVILYNTTSEYSLEATNKWKEDLDTKVSLNGEPIPAILVGNNSELLTNEQRSQAENSLKQKVLQQRYTTGALISSKGDPKFNDVMEKLVRSILIKINVEDLEEDLVVLDEEQLGYQNNNNSV
ncbi:rab17, putative [Entamoeba invadens IP1]|uniref:Rab17, putative n=1 Tax=Entamoeba invadens IP1 TaxID=370355 RepID=A0A0A1U8A9_ENTIV|nr:rab17, putative [Entamoeba invadens IP1]ELP91180.1 rab17, putative [Entamoeba invadens IP1]|eukprot:XP_004257951.1 rab17, putative [Entamoeba invadens IP1]